MALAIARAIDGVRSVFSKDRRYWLHAAWVVVKLAGPIIFWWSFWRFRDIPWNIFSFTLALAWPAVLYLQVTSLVTRQPELIPDWRAHFYNQRRWFFGANICLTLIPFGIRLFLGFNPFAGPEGIASVVTLAYSVVGFATDNEKAHGVVVALAALTIILGYFVPGAAPRAPL
jgi:hypothetical protein